MVRYAGLYARCIKRRCADIANAALEALREQIPLFATETLLKVVTRLKWRDRIKASFGYDPLSCPKCGRTMELAEIWEPQRGYVWMKRCWRRIVCGRLPEMPRKMQLLNVSAARVHLISISNCRSFGTRPEKLVRLPFLFPLRKHS